jgi:glycosyltransferase involved in cell wall biosynthesis
MACTDPLPPAAGSGSGLTRRQGVVALDDYFPAKGTGFRIAEFSWMLSHGVLSEVMTTATPLEELVAGYSAVHPRTCGQVHAYDVERLGRFEAASVLFLNNAAYFVDDLEAAAVPFVLTLYPGGGLNLGHGQAEAKLSRVLASPQLRHVITTQPLVTDHVRAVGPQHLAVTEVLGLTVDPTYLRPGAGFRENFFGSGKQTLDVAFVAHRYTGDGKDKGFPVFLDCVRLLVSSGLSVRGHIVGGYVAGDIDQRYADLDLSCYGVLSTPELAAFFAGMDLIISAPTPGQIAPGSFDGFPTGSCVEAALCGVAVAASDPLHQNRLFIDRRDIHMPQANAPDIVARVHQMLAEPDGLARVALAGLRTARRGYGIEAQLLSRRRVMESVRASLRPAH